MLRILEGDCVNIIPEVGQVDCIYMDPPFNTGKTQKLHGISYEDRFEDFMGFMKAVFDRAYYALRPHGSLFLHMDYREVHYCKVVLDMIFGRKSFKNEIIWAYDFGGRSKSKWSTKHDNILWYAKDPKHYTFNYQEMDRIPYMAPGLCGPDKAARGKTPTDVWWQTVVPTNGAERVGYPTQKPIAILRRLIKIHTNPGDLVLDPFAGSGTTGAACQELGREGILIDNNPQAIKIMKERLWQNIKN